MLLPTLCKTLILASDVRDPPHGYPCWTLNFCLYKPCAMCLSLLHFCCFCCLSNKCTYNTGRWNQAFWLVERRSRGVLSLLLNYMQLRSPEVTRVNFHPSTPLFNVLLKWRCWLAGIVYSSIRAILLVFHLNRHVWQHNNAMPHYISVYICKYVCLIAVKASVCVGFNHIWGMFLLAVNCIILKFILMAYARLKDI